MGKRGAAQHSTGPLGGGGVAQNRRSQAEQGDQPSNEDFDLEDKDGSEHQEGMILPAPWTEHIELPTGYLYYWNSVTGESTWDPPEGSRPPKDAEPGVAEEAVGEFELSLLWRVHGHFVYPAKLLSRFRLRVNSFTMPLWFTMICKMAMPLGEAKLLSGKNLDQILLFAWVT